MNKFLVFARWAVVNAGMFSLVYFGVNGVIGAERLFCFVVWFFTINIFLGSNIEKVRNQIRDKGRPIPAWLSHGVGIAMIAYLCWHGWWFSVFAMTLNQVSEAMIYHKEKPKP